MQVSSRDRDIAIRTILGEAGNEPPEGQAAVAHVLFNRLNSGQYGQSISEVALAPHQFEPWQTRRSQLMGYRQDDPAYQRVGQIFDQVASGNIPDNTGGAQYFLQPDIVSRRVQTGERSAWPSWAQNPTAQIGRHVFYGPEGGRVTDYLGTYDVGTKPGQPVQATQQPALDYLSTFDKQTQTPAASAVVPLPQSRPEAAGPRPPIQGPAAPALSSTVNQLMSGAATQPGVMGSLARFGVGGMRGMGDVADTLAEAISAGGEIGANAMAKAGLISPENAQKVAAWRKEVGGRIAAGQKDYDAAAADSTAAGIGRVGGQIAGSAPFLAAAGAMAPEALAIRAAPEGAGIVQRGITGAQNFLRAGVTGAGTGAGMSALTSSTSQEPVGEQVAEGAMAGGALGPAGRLAGMTGSGIAGMIGKRFGPTVAPEVAQLAQLAQDKYGIKLTRQQLTQGFGPPSADQMAGLERALAHEMGEATDHITPQTIKAAKDRLDLVYKQIHSQWGDIPADQTFLNGINRLAKRSDFNKIRGIVEDITDRIDKNGMISSKDYEFLTRPNGDLQKALGNSREGLLQADAKELESHLDRIAQKANPQAFALKKTADYQYAVTRTAEEAASESPTRVLTPQSIWKHFNDWHSPGVSEPARIAKQFMGNERLSPSSIAQAAIHHLGPTVATGALTAAGIGAFDADNWQRDMAVGGGLLALIAAGKYAPGAFSRPGGIIKRSLAEPQSGAFAERLGSAAPSLVNLVLHRTPEGYPYYAVPEQPR